jgi:hypothetical protein
VSESTTQAQNRALKTMNALPEQEIAYHRGRADQYAFAIAQLDSERAANALLTEEIERLTTPKDHTHG